MITPDPDDKIYPVVKIAAIVNALATEGVSAEDALAGTLVSQSALSSPETLVSLNQVLECCRNADRLSRDSHFAYHIGRRFHVSAYGIYGFAMLSSTDFRQTMRIMVQFRPLGTPLVGASFHEADKWGIWTFTPPPNPRIDARLYRFLVELQFGIDLSLHRDFMGPAFADRELHVRYGPPDDAAKYPEIFDCRVLFGQAQNEFLFDAAWLDQRPELGNEITNSMVVKLCDTLLAQLTLRIGLVGKVRQILMINLMRPQSVENVASQLNVSTRTLRRKLREENTSFRKLVDELRMDVAIKYLRDTDLTVEDIAAALGFSDAANFRHAFRRWTNGAPQQFRDVGARA